MCWQIRFHDTSTNRRMAVGSPARGDVIKALTPAAVMPCTFLPGTFIPGTTLTTRHVPPPNANGVSQARPEPLQPRFWGRHPVSWRGPPRSD